MFLNDNLMTARFLSILVAVDWLRYSTSSNRSVYNRSLKDIAPFDKKYPLKPGTRDTKRQQETPREHFLSRGRAFPLDFLYRSRYSFTGARRRKANCSTVGLHFVSPAEWIAAFKNDGTLTNEIAQFLGNGSSGKE